VRVRYVAPPVTRSSLETRTAPDTARGRRLNILSTRRPSVADVRTVVPVFQWTPSTASPASLDSQRTGNTLRVFLERPWYSSGDGELLGVVLFPSGQPAAAAVPDAVRKHVTLWGRDPIFATAATPPSLPPTAFPLAVRSQAGLTLDEVPGQPVSVAGHAVNYDGSRRLWYADIAIDLGVSYDPFVRLALARYQPDSIADAHLSRISLTDVWPLSPSRVATVTPDRLRPERIRLTLTGVTYQASAEHPAADVVVTVEQRRAGIPGDLGWEAVGSPIPMPVALAVFGVTQWAADVDLPAARGSRPFRLVLTESERYATATAGTFASRIVYLDTIEV
jgi:hypothetical protein